MKVSLSSSEEDAGGNGKFRTPPRCLRSDKQKRRAPKMIMKTNRVYANPSDVLDGDIYKDIHQLIGYCVSLGWTEKVMPSKHCIDLAETFLAKHDQTRPKKSGNK